MRLFDQAAYKFIEARRKAYVVSAAVIGIGLAAILYNVVTTGSWQNYGVDFTGGSLVQVTFTTDATVEGLRNALSGSGSYEITRFGEDRDFLIRAPIDEGMSITEVRESIEAELTTAFGAGTFTIERSELVDAKVGGELQVKAGYAILFSFLLTLIYLAIRFEMRFGLAAVIATIHDILVTLGFLAIMRIEIALPTVAAVLTIIGYSLNDTIVVFDRIRENLQKKGARKRDPIDLVNASINETLPRTILTSGTTLAVLVALLVLGGAVIHDFTIVLILGIIVGTYSSIFVASPALIEIQKRWGLGKTGAEKKPPPQPATV